MDTIELNEKTTSVVLSIDEIKILYNLLVHQFISYENMHAINLMRKIMRIVEEHDQI